MFLIDVSLLLTNLVVMDPSLFVAVKEIIHPINFVGQTFYRVQFKILFSK